ncbi:undecaprenyl/decaprenyl-phosphate alpha-N-acetylglucosaminyl 1-phosphate transferase [Streptomyces olivaceus]|uniref:Undecaprenyl/decaprenyl-phosphate alpha-N-acetylglucosaminyl 1-phosphate transferase n=1 Tax=Streptomyces olivaceus TaxID=47716 RepID=A0ABS7W460_STROV|nr:MraY family glycosyltransferase [Streptomyces olivaceus]MBZ6089977.1 undecaprenyl/decaprenyl-phosphate alpha-N-acetylglucosaminyl 1-phosphate transferase [Streptomyces olivaceus]MBZ6098488.1 undecaprenyl/decaprenyl-phosphate alpha-N-acetylglucosaminyl 1-phosphate transferase [Streptomyces olivaceus]MBZ6119291.1 undecaprenyl/decaprenyl-phosphate alpha-N-acetylglucosaminyl 1-phosphate transferase [Streptomyces olivaceus]MBZ6151976.1 undecaprenyl/decaprenyl-phosphate alpha-N-acetylglucosaminyl 
MRNYLLLLCVAAAVTAVLTGPVRHFAVVTGSMPGVRERDVHKAPTPRMGGIAMFAGLTAALLVADHLPVFEGVYRLNDIHAIFSGALLVWATGVIDDRFELAALVKLGMQLLAAGLMSWQGVTLLWIPVPGIGNVVLSSPVNIIVTVIVLLVTINAVNFIDGLDGLAAGVTAIAGAAFFLYCYRLWFGYGMEAAAPAALLSATTVGLCVGFLLHNAHPARIFMGDSGSMLLGLLLAGSCISYLGEVDPDSLASQLGGERTAVYASTPLYLAVLLPAVIIALPLADLAMAIVRRILRGQSPFAADQEHFHHRLLRVGHTHPRAVLVMYFWSALVSFGFVTYSVLPGDGTVSVILVLAATGLTVLLIPYVTAEKSRWIRR